MNRMKKKIITIAAIGSLILFTAAYSIFSTEKNQVNSLMLENIEALAQSEGTKPCNYTNGYTSFTGKSGGAYDCCQIWVNQPPGNEHCR